MTLTEAKRHLDTRMRMRFDQHVLRWSLVDATAMRLVLSHVRELEAKTSVRGRAA